jgi:hypothetical protein
VDCRIVVIYFDGDVLPDCLRAFSETKDFLCMRLLSPLREDVRGFFQRSSNKRSSLLADLIRRRVLEFISRMLDFFHFRLSASCSLGKIVEWHVTKLIFFSSKSVIRIGALHRIGSKHDRDRDQITCPIN